MLHIIHVIIVGLEQLGGGGFLMIPLLFCSLFVHAIILERFYNLRRGKLMPRHFIARIYKVLEKGNPEMALALCESRPGPLTRVLKVGIANRHLSKDDLRVVLDVTGRVEKLHLQKYLRALAFLGGVAVIIGLLGTVVGMYVSFSAVWKINDPDTTATVAKGISYALLTTVAGLVVALPAMIGYSYFTSKANSIVEEITRHSFSLVTFFTAGVSQLVEREVKEGNE